MASAPLLTTFPIDTMMKSAGYQHTLVVFGIILGLIGAAAALGDADAGTGRCAAGRAGDGVARRASTPKQMLRSRVFWLMFVMMTMMSTGGLMIISQFAAFSRDFGVANVMVFGLAALPLALTVDRLTNGLTRPFFGWVSDHIGRENTMAIAFLMEAAAVTMMVLFRDNALVLRDPLRPRVLRLGRDLLAVPLDPDRHLRLQIRDHQLRLPLYGAGRRLGARRPAGRAAARADRKLAAGVCASSSRWTR